MMKPGCDSARAFSSKLPSHTECFLHDKTLRKRLMPGACEGSCTLPDHVVSGAQAGRGIALFEGRCLAVFGFRLFQRKFGCVLLNLQFLDRT